MRQSSFICVNDIELTIVNGLENKEKLSIIVSIIFMHSINTFKYSYIAKISSIAQQLWAQNLRKNKTT